MKRRNFLKALPAAAALPLLPKALAAEPVVDGDDVVIPPSKPIDFVEVQVSGFVKVVGNNGQIIMVKLTNEHRFDENGEFIVGRVV